MRIDKICINDFGKLSNLSLSLSEGLNVIYAPNESGKSTLLAFVKFVFYGTKVKKNKGEMTFKEKYMPWKGNQMSGSVEFTHGGKKYIIYRSEGAKSGSKKLEVKEIPSGIDVNIQEPGRHFFSVGEKAFSDSCFVTDIFSITDSDDDILSMLSSSGTENASYTRVKNILEEKILSLSSLKRTSSVLSVLTRDYNEEQAKVVSATKEISDIKKDIEFFKNKKDALSKEFSLVDADIKRVSQVNLTSEYNELKSSINREEENIKILTRELSKIDIQQETPKEKTHNKTVLKILSNTSMMFVSAILFMLNVEIIIPILVFALGFIGFMFTLINAGKNKESKVIPKTMPNSVRSALERQIEISKKRLDDLNASLERFNISCPDIKGDENINTDEINSFTTEELNDIILRREKCLDELKAIDMRISSLCERCTELTQSLDAHRHSIAGIEKQIDVVNSRLEIYRTAMDILDTAFSKTRDEFVPRLCSDAMKLLLKVSKDSCDDIITNENFETLVRINNEYRSVSYLSKGAQALVYIALRMAISSRLSQEAIPVFFDDILSTFDDDRCTKMISALCDFSKERQIFLCTCRKRETVNGQNTENLSLISLRKDDNNG